MFVRKKLVNGVEYHYLVQGVRDGDRVKQKVIVYLGKHKSVEEAYLYWVREARKPERKQQAEKMLKQLEPFL